MSQAGFCHGVYCTERVSEQHTEAVLFAVACVRGSTVQFSRLNTCSVKN